MEVKLEMYNEVVVLMPVGNLVASSAEEFKTKIAKLLERRFLQMLIDFTRTDFMDSSGLGACVAARKTVSDAGGVMACCGLNDTISKVFRITRANSKIAVAANRQEGVNLVQELALAAREKTS